MLGVVQKIEVVPLFMKGLVYSSPFFVWLIIQRNTEKAQRCT